MDKKEKMYMAGAPVGGGAILTRTAIREAIEVEEGETPEITIEPYDRSCIGPCSYDIHTGTQYAVYTNLKEKRLIGSHYEYWLEDGRDPTATNNSGSSNSNSSTNGDSDSDSDDDDDDISKWGHWVEVKEYEEFYPVIDPYDPSTYISEIQNIPAEGLICYPDHVYLIGTKETVGTKCYEPILTAKSSIGRLGVSVAFADFGDIGFKGTWTLQIKTTYPTIIRANMKIGQIYFLSPSQEITEYDLYNGKYQGATGVRASEYYRDVD